MMNESTSSSQPTPAAAVPSSNPVAVTNFGAPLPLRTHTPVLQVGPRILKPGKRVQFVLNHPDWTTIAEYTSLGSRLEFKAFESILPGITAASGRVRTHCLMWRQRVYPSILALAADLAAFGRQADVAFEHVEEFVEQIFHPHVRFREAARQLAEYSIGGLEGRAQLLVQHANDAGCLLRDFQAALSEDEAAIEPVLTEIEQLDPHNLGVFLAPVREIMAAQSHLRPHFTSINDLRQQMRKMVELFDIVRDPIESLAATWQEIHDELTNLRLVIAENSPNPVLKKINYQAARADWTHVAELARAFLNTAPR